MFIEKDNVTFVTFDGVLSSCVPGKDCEVLKIPEGVKKVGFSVLDSDNGIKEIYFPESLEEISSCAFVQCEKLEKIHFSSCLKRIEDRAFLGCKSLREVALPSSLEVIAEDAFSECGNLKKVTIEENGFFEATEKGIIDRRSGNIVISLQPVVKAEAVAEKPKRTSYEKDGLVVPKGAAEIADNAFASDRTLEKIIIPEGVKRIGKRAFKLCLNLKKVILPEGLEIIDEEAFAGCVSLEEAVFPESLKEIGEDAFLYCSGLRKAAFPSGLKRIADRAFMQCESLEEAVLRGEAEYIGLSAFGECLNLKRLVLPDKTDVLGERIIKGGYPKITIEVPENLIYMYPKEIFGSEEAVIKIKKPQGAVEVDYDVEELTVSEGIKEIGDKGLSSFYAMKKLYIPASVEKIGKNILYRADSTEKIEVSRDNRFYRSEADCIIRRADNVLIAGCKNSKIPDGVTKIADGAFAGMRAHFSLTLPDGVKEIGEGAFDGCYGLYEIRFSEGLRKIGKHAFSGCGIFKLDLPGTVAEVEEQAFAACINLDSVKINEGTESVCDYAFSMCVKLTEVDLPYSLKKLGKAVFERDFSIISVKIPEKLKLKTLRSKLGLMRENQIVYK